MDRQKQPHLPLSSYRPPAPLLPPPRYANDFSKTDDELAEVRLESAFGFQADLAGSAFVLPGLPVDDAGGADSEAVQEDEGEEKPRRDLYLILFGMWSVLPHPFLRLSFLCGEKPRVGVGPKQW